MWKIYNQLLDIMKLINTFHGRRNGRVTLRMRIFLAVVIMFLSGLAIAQSQPAVQVPAKGSSQPQTKPEKIHHESTKDLREINESPLVVDIPPAPNTEKLAERKNEQENEKSSLDRLIAWSTVALAVITFFLALFTAKLWKSTGDLAKGAEDTAKRQLRAYLSAQPNYIFSFDSTKLVEIKFTIVNHGQTPASQVQSAGFIDIFPYPLPSNYPLPNLPIVSKSKSVIHPNEVFHTHVFAGRLFTTNEIDQSVQGTQFRIYVFGKVNYVDAFGENRETIFCHSVFGDQNLNAVAGGVPIPTVEIKFEPAEQHNVAT